MTDDQDFLQSKLLIAMPNMTDPRFERSLVLICAHDDEHAMGVVVNKPLANVEFSELLSQLDIDPRPGAGDQPVFFGGPVRTERGLVVHTMDYRLEATLRISPDLGLTASKEILADIAGVSPRRAPPQRYCIAIGHAGWSAGQLEGEIAANAWAHCEPDASIVFADDPSEAWRAAMAKLGVTEAMFSNEWSRTRDEDAPLN